MPELPEVETVRRTLAGVLKGQRVDQVEVCSPHCVAGLPPADFVRELEGRSFANFGRRGKYLLLWLDDGRQLVVHLRMTGQLTYSPPVDEGPGHAAVQGGAAAQARNGVDKHTHLVMTLSGGGRLRFRDQRKFGRLWLGGSPGRRSSSGGGGIGRGGGLPAGLHRLGPEPFAPEFTAACLARVLAGRRAPIKSLLINQEIVAGLGNIYADEVLHAAGLRPDRTAGGLSHGEVGRLHGAIGEVLHAAIASGGTTFSDYRDGLGTPGRYGALLCVYGRAGEICRRCGGTISRLRVGGRSSYFCPGCQVRKCGEKVQL